MPAPADYIDVAERIQQFKAKFPHSALQTTEVKDVQVGGKDFIEVWAVARTGDAEHEDGVAHAREPFPGKTNFTRDSESMNAETSAWGRAIAATGFATKNDGKTPGIATSNEVNNRKAEAKMPSAAQLDKIMVRAGKAPEAAVLIQLGAHGLDDIRKADVTQAKAILEALGV